MLSRHHRMTRHRQSTSFHAALTTSSAGCASLRESAPSLLNQNTSPMAGIQVSGWEGAHPWSASSGYCCQGCRVDTARSLRVIVDRQRVNFNTTQQHSIWSKTVSSSQTLVDADCGLQTSTLVSFRQQERALATGVSRLLARGCGTVYQLSCVSQMSS